RHDDLVPVPGGLGSALEAGGARARAERVPARLAVGPEGLAEDAVAGAVFQVALPDDDELAAGLDSHVGHGLHAGRVAVDAELGTGAELRAGGHRRGEGHERKDAWRRQATHRPPAARSQRINCRAQLFVSRRRFATFGHHYSAQWIHVNERNRRTTCLLVTPL